MNRYRVLRDSASNSIHRRTLSASVGFLSVGFPGVDADIPSTGFGEETGACAKTVTRPIKRISGNKCAGLHETKRKHVCNIPCKFPMKRSRTQDCGG